MEMYRTPKKMVEDSASDCGLAEPGTSSIFEASPPSQEADLQGPRVLIYDLMLIVIPWQHFSRWVMHGDVSHAFTLSLSLLPLFYFTWRSRLAIVHTVNLFPQTRSRRNCRAWD